MSVLLRKPKTVLEEILEWSLPRPLWLRDALRRVVQQSDLTDLDLDQIAALCRQENGFQTEGDAPLKPIPLAATHIPSSPPASASVALTGLAEIRSANQLAPDQSLTFGATGLTIIYGDNASGKSGYARILKRSCRARNPGDKISANVYDTASRGTAAARLTFRVGTKEETLAWTDGPSPMATQLSSVSVFDADCAAIHVQKKNEVAFRPFGLDVPARLAEAAQGVGKILGLQRKAIDADRDPLFQKPTWSDSTAVGKALAALSHASKHDQIAGAAKLSDEQVARLNNLRADLAKDPGAAAKEIRARVQRLTALATHVEAIQKQTSDATLTGLAVLVSDAREQREVAGIAAEKLFAGSPLPGIGEEAWRELWESARRYSEQSAYPGRTFPITEDGARCVLCQQHLSRDASSHFHKLDEFVRADTDRQAREAQDRAKTAWENLRASKVGSKPCQAGLQELQLHDPALASGLRRFVVVAAIRKRQVLRSIKDRVDPAPTAAGASPCERLRAFIRAEVARAEELEKAATDAARAKLKHELDELNDRVLLQSLLPIVEKEIARLKTAEALERAIATTNTKAITELGNALAHRVLTPQLRDRFAEEIGGLGGNRIRVELVFAGGKIGAPQYQAKLIASPTIDVSQVLSEGETTCVALAGFLTELATAEHRSGLIFDDPVCSLDHKWRYKVASRLVQEASTRQVIVFTHDIVFVHDLKDLAEESGVPIELRSLRRGSAGTGVVGDGLPWIGMKIEPRLDELGKRARAAKLLYEAGQEDPYNREVESIYSDLRATWERALEDVAFQRTVLRHRDYINTKDLKKVSALTAADCDGFHRQFQRCSGVVNSHDRSPGRNPEHPDPQQMLADIQALEEWVKDLRARQKAMG